MGISITLIRTSVVVLTVIIGSLVFSQAKASGFDLPKNDYTHNDTTAIDLLVVKAIKGYQIYTQGDNFVVVTKHKTLHITPVINNSFDIK